MTFGSCSTNHNDVFLNGKNLKKKKNKCTCAHLKIAALSSCPIIHFKNSNINSLLTNQTFLPSLPPNTIKPAIKATMLCIITEEKIFWKKNNYFIFLTF